MDAREDASTSAAVGARPRRGDADADEHLPGTGHVARVQTERERFRLITY
jgi:hypothetical protein